MLKLFILILFGYGKSCSNNESHKANKEKFLENTDYFPESKILLMREKAKEMFYFGYDNYMKHAFPLDELNPIYCSGRGPDKDNPDNININDVLGGYSLTLIDSLDTLAIMGNQSEFKHAVSLVSSYVNFDQDNIVQVFEATIRVLGGLLAAHLLIVDPMETFGSLVPKDYDNDLLHLAHDLANRLLPAFDITKTGLPMPRVNLRHGVPESCARSTCTAGAGSLTLEFGVLSHLLDDPVFKNVARRAVESLWKLQSEKTGLFGNVVDVDSGQWIGAMSGLGAGVDSFYEYLMKSYVLFGDAEDLKKFNSVYGSIKKYMRKGRSACDNGTGPTPLYVNVHMTSGETMNSWIDSLQASFTGVQVLRGDIDEAICSHALYYTIWKKYGVLPERFNWDLKDPDIRFYPLRPEFSEATYLLYQATKHPFYLHVGAEILESLENHAKARCGYATIHDVHDKSLEDRMESFFLSETIKYLYLLFDIGNPINVQASKWIFSTEGHIFKLHKNYRQNLMDLDNSESKLTPPVTRNRRNSSCDSTCIPFVEMKHSKLPLQEKYFLQMKQFVGLS